MSEMMSNTSIYSDTAIIGGDRMKKLKYIAALLLMFMVSFVGGCVGADAKTAEADEPDRFVVIERQCANYGANYDVFVDSKTGVNYLFVKSGYGGGLTVLVDAEGKPLVDRGE